MKQIILRVGFVFWALACVVWFTSLPPTPKNISSLKTRKKIQTRTVYVGKWLNSPIRLFSHQKFEIKFNPPVSEVFIRAAVNKTALTKAKGFLINLSREDADLGENFAGRYLDFKLPPGQGVKTTLVAYTFYTD